jgi:hypothetical protein
VAPTVPTTEPTLVTAGDTWRWQHADPTYPAAEGWALSYAINGVDKLAWSASYLSSSGDTHTITIAASATAVLPAGTYELTRIWTGSSGTAGQVFTIRVGNLVVLPNPATAAAGDRQSWEERTLVVVEAVLSGKVTADMQMYQIGGRTVSKLPLQELLNLRSSLRAALSYQRTGSFGARIRYAFTSPGGTSGLA